MQRRCLVVCSIATGGGVTEAFLSSLVMLRLGGLLPVAVVPKNANYLRRLRELHVESFLVPRLERGGVIELIHQSVKIARLAQKTKAGIVILHNGRHVKHVKRLLRRTPLLAICHGGNLVRFLSADRVATVNSEQKSSLEREGYPASRCAVVENALPFEPIAWPPNKQDVSRCFTVGSLLLLEPPKGADILIEAIRLLAKRGREVQGRIAGAGSQEKILKKKIQDAGLEDCIELVGWVEDKKEFLRTLDVYVQPSKSETFGIGLLEAFACALPTISTDCEGPKSLIETNENGIIVPKNDAAAIAAQIERLMDNPLLREELAEKAYQKCVANFTLPALARKFVEQVLLTRCA